MTGLPQQYSTLHHLKKSFDFQYDTFYSREKGSKKMNTKKTILSLTFIASLGYFLYDMSQKASSFLVDYSANE